MRLPYTQNLSLMLEEVSRRDEGAVGKCLQVLLYQTLADRLWPPFKFICFNPVVTFVVVVVVYLVFSIIYAPLWLASLLITPYGSFILFLVFINYLANIVSRKIAFAGSNVSVQKQISSDFFKRLSMFMESLTTLISDFTATLLLGASGQIPFNELPPMDMKLKEVMEKSASLPGLLKNIKNAVSFLLSDLTMTPQEKAVLGQLSSTLEEQVSSLQALYPLAAGYVNALEAVRRTSHGGRGVDNGKIPRGTPELFRVASHCIKSSKALKEAIQSARPPPQPEDDGGLINKVKSLLFNETLEGGEKITFPYMRCLLIDRFKAEPFSLMGCDNNTIHGVIFPACSSQQSSAANDNVDTASGSAAAPMSPVGVVMFCSPNAGFFEGMCQCDLQTSWLGYYLRHGYDVCMFNYRGYGLSTGTPHPHGIKQDACQVYEHLQVQRKSPIYVKLLFSFY